ncbi:Cytochrome p450, partial [Thalictrum thalictroides]
METMSSILPSFLLASSFLLLVVFFILRKTSSKRYNLPPCPSKLPIIGNLHQLGNSPHLSLSCLAEKFGPIFYLQLGHIPTVIISSARLAKEVLTTHDLALASRPQLYSAKHLFYNCTDMAFSPYGAYWRHIRKICILELLSPRRVQSYGFVREEEVKRMVKHISQEYPATTDLSKILAQYANDVLCRAAFGRDFSEGGESDQHGFQKMLEEYQILLGGFSLGEYFPSMEWINTLTGTKSRLINTFRRFDNFFNEIIEEHQNPKRIKQEHKDLVDVLLDLQKGETLDMALTMDNIKAVIL